jgi:hypothetical protein
MKRSTFDRLISSAGLVMAAALVLMGGALVWGHTFIHQQVADQLSEQRITFPATGSEALNALPAADKAAVSKYAGEALTTGAQAKVYANNFINVHLQRVGGGQTYAELSAAAMANPTNQVLDAQVQTMFKGETLRGLLLNAYAFDTMATVALLVGYALAAGALLMVGLSALGFRHAGTTKRR